MITEGFIIELFIRIDDAMKGIRKDSQVNLCPSEVATLGILLSLKGVGNGFHIGLQQRVALPGPHRS